MINYRLWPAASFTPDRFHDAFEIASDNQLTRCNLDLTTAGVYSDMTVTRPYASRVFYWVFFTRLTVGSF